jgi:hypothetical protein
VDVYSCYVLVVRGLIELRALRQNRYFYVHSGSRSCSPAIVSFRRVKASHPCRQLFIECVRYNETFSELKTSHVVCMYMSGNKLGHGPLSSTTFLALRDHASCRESRRAIITTVLYVTAFDFCLQRSKFLTPCRLDTVLWVIFGVEIISTNQGICAGKIFDGK